MRKEIVDCLNGKEVKMGATSQVMRKQREERNVTTKRNERYNKRKKRINNI